MKSRVIEELGQGELMLPNLVAEALRANDRAKVRMSVLQAAAEHAHDPQASLPDLDPECRGAGLDAIAIRELIADARANRDGFIEASGLSRLNEALLADVKTMVEAVRAGDEPFGRTAEIRLANLTASFDLESERMPESSIARLTAVCDEETDSLHRLVMDLHKALNRLTVKWAKESVAGALAYGLNAEDKLLVTAFMRGLERTRPLKFNHPGLDTTAVRGENRLIIQNDIGTTDAHVLVVNIEGLTATITHSDVHRSRAKFFIGLFDTFSMQWSRLRQTRAEGLAEGETFYLATGCYIAPSQASLAGFLAALGASLVFLIDWNKARKALRKLVSNSDAVFLLGWAAQHAIGHRAFLELGGAELVASVVRRAAPARIGFGQELETVLGREQTIKFFQTALKLSTDAVQNGRSARSVRETLEVDLVRRIERNESKLLTTVVRQLGLARDIAVGVARDLADEASRRSGRNTVQASRIEEKADVIALDARQAIARTQAANNIVNLVDAAENAIDDLEQAAFLASLLPADLESNLVERLDTLCAIAISGVEGAVRGVEAVASLFEGNGATNADSEEAMQATAQLVELEHSADKTERAITSLVLSKDVTDRGDLTVLELARALEHSTDRLALIGHLLHTHVMAELST